MSSSTLVDISEIYMPLEMVYKFIDDYYSNNPERHPMSAAHGASIHASNLGYKNRTNVLPNDYWNRICLYAYTKYGVKPPPHLSPNRPGVDI